MNDLKIDDNVELKPDITRLKSSLLTPLDIDSIKKLNK